MHLSSLHVYPIKSTRGIAITSGSLDDFGLQHDRRWMVVDPSGTFMSQREAHRLALVEVADAVGRLTDDPALAELPPNWRDGLAALRGKIDAALATQSVTPIPAETLDLRMHHVVETCDGPGEPDRIARVVRPGYLWNERVLRPAVVVTVKTKSETEPSP